MLIYPAVDIKSGKAVRLVQGRADQQTIYDDDPVHAAQRLGRCRARTGFTLSDLDGAFDGVPKNVAFTLAIAKAARRPQTC